MGIVLTYFGAPDQDYCQAPSKRMGIEAPEPTSIIHNRSRHVDDPRSWTKKLIDRHWESRPNREHHFAISASSFEGQ